MCEKCDKFLKEQCEETRREVSALAKALTGDTAEAVELIEQCDGTESIDTYCAYIACRVAILASIAEKQPAFMLMAHWGGMMMNSELKAAAEAAAEHEAEVAERARNN